MLTTGSSAQAYETDQLTDRHLPLPDAAPAANAQMDEVLDRAIRRTRRRVGCGDPEHTFTVLARSIHKVGAKNKLVLSKGFFRSFGHGSYAAWLETTPALERRDFLEREDLYGEVSPWHSAILAIAGPSSTLRLAGVLMGTDKPDHFLELGFNYLQRSRWGAEPARAYRYGARTERRGFGLWTSKAFSFADLAANRRGFEFYRSLLGKSSPIQLDDEGCAVRVADWRWSRWVDWRWDEVLNPSVYTPIIQRNIAERLRRDREVYCTSYAAWGSKAYHRLLARVLRDPPTDYMSGEAPPRTDPYQLARLCDPARPYQPASSVGAPPGP